MTDEQQNRCSAVSSNAVIVSYPLLHINGSLYVDKNVQNSQASYISSKSRRLEITFDEVRDKQKVSENDVKNQGRVYQLPLSANVHFDDDARETTSDQNCNNQKSDEEQPSQQSMPTHMILCKNLETGHSMKWPILENSSTRVLVPLKIGENRIKLQNGQNKLEECVINVSYKPVENKRFVRPVYIVCANSDGKFEAPSGEDNSVESAKQRLAFNTRILQTFTAEHMNLHGFGRITFRLEEDDNGDVKVNVFQSKLELDSALCMSGEKLYDYFQKELNDSNLYDPLCKFWVFMSCTRYMPPSDNQFDEKKVPDYVKGHTALGGGNMALFGTGCLHTWARNLDEFVSRFVDDRIIDRKSLFDDSARRGYYWANYATTLGAAMHELGHTFNLPHTPSGIMGRGFDDMNIFFVGKREPDINGLYAPEPAIGIYRDKGAHWHRASAAVLSCSRWIGDCRDNKTPCEVFAPIMYSTANKRGPLGSGSDGSGKSLKFSSEQWLKADNLDLKGFKIRARKYINAIQILGTKQETLNAETNASSTEISSQWFGNQETDGKMYEFLLDNDGEKLISIDVRAASWLDAVRFHSSHKSSTWIGGKGGNLYNLSFGDSNGFDNIFGTAGEHVTSIGIAREGESVQALDKEYCYFYSQYGIRVVEVRQKNGEVLKHWEFLDGAPQQNVPMLMADLFTGNAETVAVYDGNGECADFNVSQFKSTLQASP